MRKAITKAEHLRSTLRPTNDTDFEVDGMLRLNIEGCKYAIVFTDEIINELYWWQVGKKIFWQRVKIELYSIKEECVFRLNKYNIK